MGWKRLEVGGQLGICCQRVQLTAVESVGEAAVYGESSKEKPLCQNQGRWGEFWGLKEEPKGGRSRDAGPEADHRPARMLPWSPGAHKLTSSRMSPVGRDPGNKGAGDLGRECQPWGRGAWHQTGVLGTSGFGEQADGKCKKACC